MARRSDLLSWRQRAQFALVIECLQKHGLTRRSSPGLFSRRVAHDVLATLGPDPAAAPAEP